MWDFGYFCDVGGHARRFSPHVEVIAVMRRKLQKKVRRVLG